MNLDYWYDGQLRRYVKQLIAIFSGFQWQGKDKNGETYLRTVPIKWAASERQVATILNNNSENTLITCPQMSLWITGIEMNDEMRREPNFVSHINVCERDINPETNEYNSQLGNTYTVERFMPVPYTLRLQLDIWTSNTMQKDQIIEQIMVLFNPSIDFQTGTNPIDWISLTTLHMTGMTYSSRSIPIGTSDEIDIASFEFETLIHISPPAKIKKQNIIHQIITNIGDYTSMPSFDDGDVMSNGGKYWSDDSLFSRLIVTPENHQAKVEGNTITLLNSNGIEHDEKGNIYSWKTLLERYGKFRPDISQFRIKTVNNIESYDTDIYGTVNYHPLHENKLLWTIDMSSMKENTMEPILSIINPDTVGPGVGLPLAQDGQRYIVGVPIPKGKHLLWGDLTANMGDVIEYRDNMWHVVFNSETNKQPAYVLNQNTNKQLMWDFSENSWIYSMEGIYYPGYWRIFL